MKKTISLAIAIIILSPSLATVASAQSSRDDSVQQTSKGDKAAFDSTCISNAIQLREDAIAGAFTKFSTAQTAALAARKAGLIAALAKPTARERADARKATWTTFRTTSKQNHNDLKTARKTAWDTYKATMRNSCKGGRAELSGDQSSGGSLTESL